MPRFEVGRVYNLGGSKPEASEEVKPHKTIGFVSAEKNEKPHKMDRIGFAPSSEIEKPTEETKEK